MKLLGVAEVAKLARVSRQAVVNWRGRHTDFPPPLAELSSGPIWQSNAIQRWLRQKANRPPSWALPGGLPSHHIVRAALHVAGVIDSHGSTIPSTRHGYTHYPTGGLFPPQDLVLGEQLLIDCDLVRVEDGVLYPMQNLRAIAGTPQRDAIEFLLARAISISSPPWIELGESPPPDVIGVLEGLMSDPSRREAFLLAIGSTYDPSLRVLLGARGEEEVAEEAQKELIELGREDLASRVQRVGLVSDKLGYDVVAPRLDGAMRRMEVKTTAKHRNGTIGFYLSRNEIEIGRRDSSWALVVCRVETDDTLLVEGWCRASSLEPYLPLDSPGGRWQEAEIMVPSTLLVPGIPPAI